ncbi:Pvc16 family protein [Myceligenerans halotolerans]
MSNTLAIAAVTSTIRYVLHESLGGDEPAPVGGADVTTLRPAQVADLGNVGQTAAGLNVYLYQVTPNHASNLDDLPTRHRDGTLARRPAAALDLHYLVTAYGDEEALEPQRLLARSALALAATPVFTKAVIENAVATFDTGATDFLDATDLADQDELVKITPTPLPLEELSKLWGVLGTGYLLSQAYTATVVLLQAGLPVRTPLPVLTRDLAVRPFSRVLLDDVAVAGDGPAVTGATLVLTGRGLLDARTVVRVAGEALEPDPSSRSTRLVTTLTGAVRAGVHGVQVVHEAAPGAAGEPTRVLGRSDTLPLVVRPGVGTLTTTGTRLEVPVTPALQEGQRAVVSLARIAGGDAADPPLVEEHFGPVSDDDAPADRLDVPLSSLTAGTWLVRVAVDGVASLPTMSGDTYDGPAVTLP